MAQCPETRFPYYPQRESTYHCDLPEGHDGLHGFVCDDQRYMTLWRSGTSAVWSQREIDAEPKSHSLDEYVQARNAVKALRDERTAVLRGKGKSRAALVVFGDA